MSRLPSEMKCGEGGVYRINNNNEDAQLVEETRRYANRERNARSVQHCEL